MEICSGFRCACPSGRRTVNCVPGPSGLASTLMEPWWSRTRDLVRFIPMPAPPFRASRPLSACQKRSKICLRSSSLMPMPLSVKRSTAMPLSSLRIMLILPESPVNLNALESMLTMILSRPLLSAHSTRPSIPSCLKVKSMPRSSAWASKMEAVSVTNGTRSVGLKCRFIWPLSIFWASII